MYEVPTKITRKGQVTIPARVRRELGLSVGDRISFIVEDGTARLKRAESVVERTKGAVKWDGPVYSAEELRRMAEEAIAEDVMERGRR